MTALAVRDTGEGRALLLLHAYPLDSSQWDAQVAALSGEHRCLRPDFWGCAASLPPPGEITIDGYAQTVLDELDRRDIAEVAVVGSSMGGYTALALWRLAPARVRALILVGTRAAADTDAARADRGVVAARVRAEGVEGLVEPTVERLLCPRCREEVHIADPLRGRIRRWTPEGVVAALAMIGGRPDSTGLLASITVPALVIGGTGDAMVSLEETRALAQAIPGAVVRVLEGTGHLPNIEQPQRVSALLAEFLSSTAR